MACSSRWRRMSETALASLVLAAAGLLSTAEARAGCDHPWVERPAQLRTLADLAILDLAGDPDGLGRDTPAAPRPSPCARGACSPTPMIPISSPEPTPRRADLWGLSCRCPRPQGDPSLARHIDEHPPSAHHQAVPIDRPPR